MPTYLGPFLFWQLTVATAKAERIREAAGRDRLSVEVRQLDVYDDRSVKSTIDAIPAESGKIDVFE
jgi:NADP-dependent 3-hydroxy acid dehydrogenase YdfG